MTADEVLKIYSLLEGAGIKLWIDGGWCVDALLGIQTRPHKDLDIALEWKDVPTLRELLAQYKEVRADNQWNFVLADDQGNEIDVHAFVCNATGEIVGGALYPVASLTGLGVIKGKTVRCISPEYIVKFHSGYELKEKDFNDVWAICKKFGIPLPKEFERFVYP